MRIALHYVFTRQFSRVLTPGHSSLGFSRESPARDMWYYVAYVYNGELVFPLMGNQRVGIFPPKSKILFVLSLALIWCQNFQDGAIPVGGDTWSSFFGKKNNNADLVRASKINTRPNVFVRLTRSYTADAVWYRQHSGQPTNTVMLNSKWIACGKSQLTIERWSCDRPETFDVTWRAMT